MVPIVGLDNSDLDGGESQKKTSIGPVGSFAATQPPRLVRAVAQQLGLQGQRKSKPYYLFASII
jgi:aminopeptidase I